MTKTETVSAERLREIMSQPISAELRNLADNFTMNRAMTEETINVVDAFCRFALLAAEMGLSSRTQSPAEWQVEAAAKAFDPHAFKTWQQSYDYEMGQSGNADEAKAFADWSMGKRIEEVRAAAREALRAAYITPPAPERSKEETVGVLSVPDAMAQLAAAIEAEERRNAVRDEMLATVIVNLEKSELTAEFAVLLRDYVRAERAKLSALETPPLHKEGEAKVGDEVVFCPECGWNSAMDAAPAPVPVTITDGWQPIETAPKDGTAILGWRTWDGDYKSEKPNHIEVWWHTDRFGFSGFMDWEGRRWKISHWMPLLPPPAALSAKPTGEE